MNSLFKVADNRNYNLRSNDSTVFLFQKPKEIIYEKSITYNGATAWKYQ